MPESGNGQKLEKRKGEQRHKNRWERETHRDRQRQTDRQNSNSKTFVLKDSNVKSIWAYLTASPCYTTNTNKHDYTTNRYKYE